VSSSWKAPSFDNRIRELREHGNHGKSQSERWQVFRTVAERVLIGAMSPGKVSSLETKKRGRQNFSGGRRQTAMWIRLGAYRLSGVPTTVVLMAVSIVAREGYTL
jgi:hypothetical protein